MNLLSKTAVWAVLTLGVFGLAGVNSAHAQVMSLPDTSPQPGEENVLLPGGLKAPALPGTGSQSDAAFQFDSGELILSQISGQTTISPAEGIPSLFTRSVPGGTYTSLSLGAPSTSTNFTDLDQLRIVDVHEVVLSGLVNASALVTQPPVDVPEPGNIALLIGLGVTASLFASVRLRRRRKQIRTALLR